MRRYIFLSAFLWCMVEVRPQTYPYVSFLGQTLPNNSYVDLSLVGINQNGTDGLQCHTDLATCCGRAQGEHRGDWFSPTNSRLPFPTAGNVIVEDREAQRVDLRQRNASSPTGIFRCTIDVAGEDEPVKKSTYVGLYLGDGGNVRISGGVTLTVISDLNGPSPQFTLTCISTGGPATTVTWTRDDVTFMRGTETVLDDPETAQYTHTLTVSGRPEGLYTCTVSNSKPSRDSAELNTGAPFEEFILVDSSSTSLTFSWTLTPVASLLISGYNITCTPLVEGIPLPEPLVVRERNAATASVTELYPGVSYTCAIVTFNSWQTSLPRNITYSIPEIAPSGSPEIFEAVAGQRQVVFTWSPLPVTQRNGVITNYTLSCSPSPSTLPQSPSSQSGSLTVTGFSPNTLYSCSLTANNNRGSGPAATTSFTTLEDFAQFQLHLGEVASCLEYKMSSVGDKLDDIVDALLETLTTSCADCAITSSTIDEEYFVCDPESPGYVTYRARLEGTSETDSGSLVSLIETWVKTGPNITAGGHHLTVNAEPLISQLPDPDPVDVIGSVRIIGEMRLSVISDLNGPSPQFTLTCISTGGPATTVTWTRDSTPVAEGTETVLDDPETAQYTHTLTVSGRPEGLYTCTVSNSKPSQDSAQLKIDGLAGAPEEFEVEVGERKVIFYWSPPPPTQHGGSITNYTLSCSPSPSSLPQSPSSQSGSLTVTGFSPNTLYSCSLTANNNRGSGPAATTSFTTLEDYVLFWLHFSGIPGNCQDFKDVNEREKLDNVTSAVLVVLSESCANCALDEEYFVCDPESPGYVTYRARLEGTSETDSGSLVSLIETWVKTGPNITAGGYYMTVSSECPPSVSDTNEGPCRSSTDDTDESFFTKQNIIIIAGAGGGALLIIFVVLICIIILCCCKCCCRHKKSFKPSDIEIVHNTMGEQKSEEAEEDFEKVEFDGDKQPSPQHEAAETEKTGYEPRNSQDTDEREDVSENIC